MLGKAALVRAVLDRNKELWGGRIMGIPIAGGEDAIPELIAAGADAFAVGVGAVGPASPRERLFETGVSFGLEPLTAIHPAASVSGWASVGEGSQIFASSVVNAAARLGVNAIVNSGAIVEHDCVVEAHSHIAPGARVLGGAFVGRGALIGAGATIRQGIRVGDGAVVGAGAVVVKDVPGGVTVAGVPAKVMRSGSVCGGRIAG